MATLAEHPTVAPSYDQDIDSFLNLDQLTYTSSEPARSKAALGGQPALPSTEYTTADIHGAGFPQNGQSPLSFQGPSHQYDEHKQQTGLPPGALAQAMPFQQMNNMGFGANSGFAMNGDMYSGQLKREDAPLDFNTVPTRNNSEMDLEFHNMGALPTYYSSPSPSSKSQFVDPSALGGQEVASAGPSTQVGRMYPGMHQQQAAMAKAAQQKQQEMLRQQQMQQQQQQQQQRHMEEQQVPQASSPQSQSSRNSNPAVDERISRLLQQMRQNAMGSPDDSPSPSMLPQMAKARKEEQDMDEDERLLASEEGKKLSSKERRQLRNKVSARAFRSRRKEYIGQLESEVAARTNEAHDLRLHNRALCEENARLTDLARMLLSSPQFSQFFDEMNVGGLPMPTASQPQQQSVQQPQQSQSQLPPQQPTAPQSSLQPHLPKETNSAHGTQEFAMQQNSQVGMVMVPNQNVDMSTLSLNGTGGWNSGIDVNYGSAPVFAVLEVPEPPVVDTAALSGKTSDLGVPGLPEVTGAKDEAPVVEQPPAAEETNQSTVGAENPDVHFDESDPAFALFADSPAPTTPDSNTTEFSGDLCSEKSAPTFELVVATDSQAAANRFACLCHNMEAAFQRVSMVTSHLS